MFKVKPSDCNEWQNNVSKINIYQYTLTCWYLNSFASWLFVRVKISESNSAASNWKYIDFGLNKIICLYFRDLLSTTTALPTSVLNQGCNDSRSEHFLVLILKKHTPILAIHVVILKVDFCSKFKVHIFICTS